ncbi:MAG: ABC transporter substrate-binding protein [Acidobacteriaceae bacterium]
MRIVALQPSVSIILDRLGCLDALAACTKYCLEAVPALRERDLPIVHNSWSTKAEELLPVRADLAIASVPYRQESLTAILKSGTPVLALVPHTLADVYSDIRHVARIANVAGRGEAIIAEMRTAVEAVREHTKDLSPRPLVSCEEWGKPLIHSQPWVAELVEIAGSRFLGAPGATTTPQAIAGASPDVIVAAWCGAGTRVPLEKIVAQRQWQHLSAVGNRRVYCVADEFLNTPAPTLIDGLHALAGILHPNLFTNPREPSVRRIEPIPASTV